MEGGEYKTHKTRRLLREYIGENPGVSFKILMNAFIINKGTLTYHLDYLVRRKIIVQEKKGRERCYSPYIKKRFPFTSPNLKLNVEQEHLLMIISNKPGISYKMLKERSKLKKSSFVYSLNRLKDLKLIWRVKGRDGFGYEIVTEEKLKDKMFLILVTKYIDGEMDRDTLMTLIDDLI